MPLLSDKVIRNKAVTVQLNFTDKAVNMSKYVEKTVQKTVLSNEKAAMSQQSVLSNKADLTQLNKDFMNTNDFTTTNSGKKLW